MRVGKVRECCGCERVLPENKFQKGRSKCRKCKNIWVRYRISGKEFYAMLNNQMSRCLICEEKITEYTAVVDHCHDDKQVRSILCRGCNLAIGFMKHDSEIAYRSVEYLRKYA